MADLTEQSLSGSRYSRTTDTCISAYFPVARFRCKRMLGEGQGLYDFPLPRVVKSPYRAFTNACTQIALRALTETDREGKVPRKLLGGGRQGTMPYVETIITYERLLPTLYSKEIAQLQPGGGAARPLKSPAFTFRGTAAYASLYIVDDVADCHALTVARSNYMFPIGGEVDSLYVTINYGLAGLIPEDLHQSTEQMPTDGEIAVAALADNARPHVIDVIREEVGTRLSSLVESAGWGRDQTRMVELLQAVMFVAEITKLSPNSRAMEMLNIMIADVRRGYGASIEGGLFLENQWMLGSALLVLVNGESAVGRLERDIVVRCQQQVVDANPTSRLVKLYIESLALIQEEDPVMTYTWYVECMLRNAGMLARMVRGKHPAYMPEGLLTPTHVLEYREHIKARDMARMLESVAGELREWPGCSGTDIFSAHALKAIEVKNFTSVPHLQVSRRHAMPWADVNESPFEVRSLMVAGYSCAGTPLLTICGDKIYIWENVIDNVDQHLAIGTTPVHRRTIWEELCQLLENGYHDRLKSALKPYQGCVPLILEMPTYQAHSLCREAMLWEKDTKHTIQCDIYHLRPPPDWAIEMWRSAYSRLWEEHISKMKPGEKSSTNVTKQGTLRYKRIPVLRRIHEVLYENATKAERLLAGGFSSEVNHVRKFVKEQADISGCPHNWLMRGYYSMWPKFMAKAHLRRSIALANVHIQLAVCLHRLAFKPKSTGVLSKLVTCDANLDGQTRRIGSQTIEGLERALIGKYAPHQHDFTRKPG